MNETSSYATVDSSAHGPFHASLSTQLFTGTARIVLICRVRPGPLSSVVRPESHSRDYQRAYNGGAIKLACPEKVAIIATKP